MPLRIPFHEFFGCWRNRLIQCLYEIFECL